MNLPNVLLKPCKLASLISHGSELRNLALHYEGLPFKWQNTMTNTSCISGSKYHCSNGKDQHTIKRVDSLILLFNLEVRRCLWPKTTNQTLPPPPQADTSECLPLKKGAWNSAKHGFPSGYGPLRPAIQNRRSRVNSNWSQRILSRLINWPIMLLLPALQN